MVREWQTVRKPCKTLETEWFENAKLCEHFALSLIHISEPTRLLSIGVGGVWV